MGAIVVAAAWTGSARGSFVPGSLSPEGTTGTGGSITFAEIDTFDGGMSAPVYADFTAIAAIPVSFLLPDQIQIVGKTLYLGIGTRTENGQAGAYTGGVLDDLGGTGYFYGGLGRTYGESAYNGTIDWIKDLDAVVNQAGSANAWTVEPPPSLQARLQQDSGPFTDKAPGHLVVHSAGTRNPFGLCLDSSNNL